MYLYEDQFSEIHDFPKVDRPVKVLVIASTARCGSHMLGHALHQTGKFGFPLEYMNHANLAEWKKRIGSNNIEEVLQVIQSRRTSTNGVFGIKIHYSHIQMFGGFEKVMQFFPNAYYVLLSRNDVLRQAVSLSIAKQTGVWISGQQPVNDNPEYDSTDIENCLRQTILDNASWRFTLAASGSNYIEMDFDQARRNLPDSVQKVADFIDIQIDQHDIPTEQVTKKQSNSRNREWAERFVSEFKKSDKLLQPETPGLMKRIKGKVFRVLGA
ncbi:MAG: Stf0 sulfotransferase [Verrucomicrobiae bacterium]|nr:Stf0 sulfotransferase [Verrucomicrobiae bacterium]